MNNVLKIGQKVKYVGKVATVVGFGEQFGGKYPSVVLEHKGTFADFGPNWLQVDTTTVIEYGLEVIDTSHGSFFDRGSADSYYGRPYNPHCNKIVDGTYVKFLATTHDEYALYKAGWDHNNSSGDVKDYGDSLCDESDDSDE
jgi:hypothetical protein